MTTAIAPALTPKQKQVRDLLAKGLAPAEVAKRLRISPSGVYGHIRNMRAAGIELPAETTESNGASAEAPPPPAPVAPVPDGEPDPTLALREAIEYERTRVSAIAEEIAEHETEIAALRDEHETRSARAEKYQAALEQIG